MEKILSWTFFIGCTYCLIYYFIRLCKNDDYTIRYLMYMMVWFFGGIIVLILPYEDKLKPIQPSECFTLSDKDSTVVIFKYDGERVYVKDDPSIKTNSYNLYYKSYYNFMGLCIANNLIYKKVDK